ncbi:hypothetical protein ACL2XP_14115 [Sodalis sp. RH21]|uniref:hypothetical protein n=1 Tax=unclassified Sodalis (in: enterobacteria) TaxID=2636512 RepID=UPI0039B5FEA2
MAQQRGAMVRHRFSPHHCGKLQSRENARDVIPEQLAHTGLLRAEGQQQCAEFFLA